MAWAEQEKASGRDHSLDEPWEQDPKLSWIDTYLKSVMVIMLLPKILVFIIPMLITAMLITIPMSLMLFFLRAESI